MKVDNDSQLGLQLHQQIRAILRNQIANGEYVVGDRLPTEQELGEHYNVSRVTVRLALKELVEEGILDRHPGRGTFLSRYPPVDRSNADRQLIDPLTLIGEWTRLRKGRAQPPLVVSQELDLPPGGDAAFFVKIISNNKSPQYGVKRFFRPALLPFFDDDLLSALDFDAKIADRIDGQIEIDRIWIESILVEPHMVMILDVPIGSALLSVWWTTVVGEEKFSVNQMLFPGNSVGVTVDLPPQPDSSAI